MTWYMKLLVVICAILAGIFFFLPGSNSLDWTFKIWASLISVGFSWTVILMLQHEFGFKEVVMFPVFILLGSVMITGLLQWTNPGIQLLFTVVAVAFSTLYQGVVWAHCWRKMLLRPQQHLKLATS